MYNIIILCLEFKVDEDKNSSNKLKHGISFEEAASFSMIGMRLFLIIGYSSRANCLTISHCLKQNETIIRIISARKATKKEREEYAKLRGKEDERRIRNQ